MEGILTLLIALHTTNVAPTWTRRLLPHLKFLQKCCFSWNVNNVFLQGLWELLATSLRKEVQWPQLVFVKPAQEKAELRRDIRLLSGLSGRLHFLLWSMPGKLILELHQDIVIKYNTSKTLWKCYQKIRTMHLVKKEVFPTCLSWTP